MEFSDGIMQFLDGRFLFHIFCISVALSKRDALILALRSLAEWKHLTNKKEERKDPYYLRERESLRVLFHRVNSLVIWCLEHKKKSRTLTSPSFASFVSSITLLEVGKRDKRNQLF